MSVAYKVPRRGVRRLVEFMALAPAVQDWRSLPQSRISGPEQARSRYRA